MTKIEGIFGGILLMAVVAAVCFALFQNGLPQIGSPKKELLKKDGQVNEAVFTGVYKDDMCTCYESGYTFGSKHGNVDSDPDYSIDASVFYKSGFSACRAAVGFEGGAAWSDGWSNGETKVLTQRRCKFYLKNLNIR